MLDKKKQTLYTVLSVILIISMAAFLLQGCGNAAKPVSGSGFPMQITDDLGRVVTIKEAPQRIVSLAPAMTEILFALDLGDKVVGVTNYCNYPDEAKTKPKVGGFSTPNAELVVTAKPDLVLATKINENFIPQLESAGLTVVVIESLDMVQVLEDIKLVGKFTGAAEAANKLTADMQKRIDSITAKISRLPDEQKPAVYFEIWPDPLTTGGSKSFVNSLITMAGGKNIAGDVEQDWVNLSPEMVLARDPKVAILCHHGSSLQTVEEFKSRKGWEQVSAIRNDRVGLVVDENTVVRPAPRMVEGFEFMAKLFHPDLIK
ncbi:ABC transporter substrate-binding protein [Pelotomaculum propionicicum]|uniref:ABC transporter substrate-binding protein n=1 Tax=Pelotomaculum propionicicum TaxID=258475 RepID=UPI003B803857